MLAGSNLEDKNNDDLLADRVYTLMEKRDSAAARKLLEQRLLKPLRHARLLSYSIICFRNSRSTTLLDKLYQNLAVNGQVKSAGNYVASGLPFIGAEKSNSHRDFLVVSGAPRSGTSSFGRMLNLHDEVAVLVERYMPYFGYHPDMFLGQNVFSPGIQNHRHAEYMQKLKPKFRKARWVGDKRPNFAYGAAITKQQFAGCELRIFHIQRDMREVCWSYENKVKRSLDEWGYKKACFEYNYNNRALLKTSIDCHSGIKIYVVDYRRLHSDLDYAVSVFEKLDIEIDSTFLRKLENYLAKSAKVLKIPRELSPDISQYIEKNIDWSTEKALKKFSLV